MLPPVRELLASFLQRRHESVLKRLLALVQSEPDLDELREAVKQGDYQHSIGTLLLLLARNVADPNDERCFVYAAQRAQERYSQQVSADQMLRLVALHRQVVYKMIQRHFSQEPNLARRMNEIIDGQFSQLQLTLNTAYQTMRDQQWRVSETKYYSLFENASEAILSFRPGEGRVIEMNAQAVRLLGRERADVLGTSFVDVFTPEHHEQAQWLVDHEPGTANIRLEDMAVRRFDGMAVPVSLSCNWTQVNGDGVAQVIMRDITQLRQMQRELRDYADQLEARVAERTRELQLSEERYRELFLQEQRRAQHLSLINEVGRCGLENIRDSTKTTLAAHIRGVSELLHQSTLVLQSHFPDCDAVFYLCRNAYEDLLRDQGPQDKLSPADSSPQPFTSDECGDLIVVAQSGGRGLTPPPGTWHPFAIGVPGLSAQNGEVILLERDAASDDRYHRAIGVHRDSEAQLCVPVCINNAVAGVITLCSLTPGAFDGRDAGALETVAGIIAGHLQSSRLFREMRELSEFHQTLTNTMLHSLLITGRDGLIRVVNERLCLTLQAPREALLGQPLERVLGESAVQKHDLHEVLRVVRTTGVTRELQDVHVRVQPEGAPEHTVVFDVRFFRIFFRGEPQVVVLMINVTQRWRRENQMQMMNEMGRLFQSSLDVDTVLHTVLTCITAGSALGFNRAFVFLRDEGTGMFRGAMALGPSSVEEASRIWWELTQREMSLQDILAEAPKSAVLTPLQERVMAMMLDMGNPALPALSQAVHETRAFRVTPEMMFADIETVFHPTEEFTAAQARRGDEYRREYLMARELFIAQQAAIAPLVATDRVIGVVIADNLYSGTPIEDDDLQLLDTLARQAGLAIDNARAYEALQRAQKDLLAADRLVVIGELAARVSHEIRNPLATIGGWARNLQKKADNPGEVQRKAGIIVDEVKRLEELLSDVLGIAKTRPLNLEPHRVNEIVERALMLAEADIRASKVEVEKQYEDLPLTLVDRSRLIQGLLNIIRNGAQSMSGKEHGVLHISTRLTAPPDDVLAAHPDTPSMIDIAIRDEGKGISEQALRQVFDPFFSTKLSGSGLGLSVTRRIVQDHGGEIDVESEPGQGTTFVLRLPYRPVPDVPAETETAELEEV